jgi:hypothetical protein
VSANFGEYPFRNCLEIRNRSRNGGSEGGHEGSKGHRSTACCHQRSPVQKPQAIFQTVSPRTSVNSVFWSHHAAFHLRLIYAGWIGSKMSLSSRAVTTFFNQ